MAEIYTWKILLIDDDEDDYLLTRDMLAQASGRQITLKWVSTYAEGRAQLTGGILYDAVLVDYDLGPKTGLDLIREVGSGCAYPIILLTGRGSYAVDVEAMQAGVSLYLTKDEANPLLLERGIRYAIQMKEHERILENRNGRLQLLSDLAAQLLRKNDPVKLLDSVSQRLTQLVEMDVYVHYQRSEDTAYLQLAAIGGYPEAIRAQLKRLEYGQAVCGTVAKTCRPIIVQDVQQSEEEMTRLIRHLGITAYACHPLMVQGRLYGTLSFGSRTRRFLDPETVDLLRTVCDLIAVAFERGESERIARRRKAQQWLGTSADLDFPGRL